MLATLRQRDFALLWSAGLVSMVGTWVLVTVLPFYVHERTGSALASGLVWLAYYLPGLLLGSVAGVFVDRWDRRRTMIAVNLLQALVLLGLIPAGREGWLWLVYPVLFAEAALGQFSGPAENALLPRLVGEERLPVANALNALNDNLARVVGPALGGVLVAVGDLSAAVLVDSASFLGAAGLIALVAAPAAPPRAEPDPGRGAAGAWVSVWREWAAGLGLIRADRLLRAVFLVAGVAALADSILTALLVPFIAEVVGAGGEAFGFILTVRGVSGLLGGLAVGWLGPRVAPGRLLGWSLVLIGAALAVEVNVPEVALIVGITLALGPAIVGWLTAQQTLLQAGTSDRYRGRVFGAYGTTNALMLILGTGLASTLGEVGGIVPTLNASAALYAGAGVLALVLLRSAAHAEPAPGAREEAGSPATAP